MPILNMTPCRFLALVAAALVLAIIETAKVTYFLNFQLWELM